MSDCVFCRIVKKEIPANVIHEDEEVVAFDGEAVVHRVLPLSVTFDHRAVTGAEAARFISALKAALERAE